MNSKTTLETVKQLKGGLIAFPVLNILVYLIQMYMRVRIENGSLDLDVYTWISLAVTIFFTILGVVNWFIIALGIVQLSRDVKPSSFPFAATGFILLGVWQLLYMPIFYIVGYLVSNIILSTASSYIPATNGSFSFQWAWPILFSIFYNLVTTCISILTWYSADKLLKSLSSHSINEKLEFKGGILVVVHDIVKFFGSTILSLSTVRYFAGIGRFLPPNWMIDLFIWLFFVFISIGIFQMVMQLTHLPDLIPDAVTLGEED